MPDILSQSDIDALLGPVSDTSDSKSGNTQSESRPVITYDFKHSHYMSRNQLRRLENLHEELTRWMATSFSQLQETPVKLHISFVDQTSYAEFIMSLSNPSCLYTFWIDPPKRPAILAFSLPVAFSFVEREFGGRGLPLENQVRSLTGIEKDVMDGVVSQMCSGLKRAWEGQASIEISGITYETNPNVLQIATPSDTVILIAMEMKTESASGLIYLAYPSFTLEPIVRNLDRAQGVHPKAEGTLQTRQERLAQLKQMPVEVRIVLAEGKVLYGELANLHVGDFLLLKAPIDLPARLYIDKKPIFEAQVHRSPGGRYGVHLLKPLEDPEKEKVVSAPVSRSDSGFNVDSLELNVALELCRESFRWDTVLNWKTGCTFELGKSAAEPIRVFLNHTLFALGEAVVYDQNFGVRLTEIIQRQSEDAEHHSETQQQEVDSNSQISERSLTDEKSDAEVANVETVLYYIIQQIGKYIREGSTSEGELLNLMKKAIANRRSAPGQSEKKSARDRLQEAIQRAKKTPPEESPKPKDPIDDLDGLLAALEMPDDVMAELELTETGDAPAPDGEEDPSGEDVTTLHNQIRLADVEQPHGEDSESSAESEATEDEAEVLYALLENLDSQDAEEDEEGFDDLDALLEDLDDQGSKPGSPVDDREILENPDESPGTQKSGDSEPPRE